MWVILRLQYVKLSHFSIFIIWCKCSYQKPKASFILFYFLNPRQPQGLAFFSQLLHTQWIGLMANVAFLILLNEVFFHYQKIKIKNLITYYCHVMRGSWVHTRDLLFIQQNIYILSYKIYFKKGIQIINFSSSRSTPFVTINWKIIDCEWWIISFTWAHHSWLINESCGIKVVFLNVLYLFWSWLSNKKW